ncbi:putative glycosyl hydrolase [Beggiatoa alba B18LD]|uniref:Putative glycosyl hydrolase n=1 Tax=Beggiatoa alba B18LD TaxID=395493 RepID=I3CI41_9GAMM|nr:LysM peptidoglycan-binding domain-containing protein [Beggiatoa alba]EIJ43284.1 putative glycosyl hydrolase [Beggiatoa alba B18LD]
MYRTLTFAKRWTVLGLAITALISGCSTVETTEPTPTDDGYQSGYPTDYPTDISLPDSSGTPTAGGQYYTVVAGDTLYSIARRYGTDWRAIATDNGIVPPYALSVGQQLIVSGSSGGYTGAVTAPVTSSPIPQPTPTPSYSYPSTSTNYPSTSTTTSGGNVHIVQRGESLYGIARMYNVDFRNLAAWNNIPEPYTISVGQQLILYPSGTTGSTTAAVPVSSSQGYASSQGTHTVQAGETLYSISKRYGYSVQQMASLNNIAPPYTLSVGQVLVVGSAGNSSAVAQASYRATTSRTTASSSDQYHTVAQGDTLYNIARRYGFTPADIASWNNIAPPYSIILGQRLLVSPPSASSYGANVSNSNSSASTLKTQSVTRPSTTTTNTVKSNTATSTDANTSRSYTQPYNYHMVGQGETLGSIAERYGLTTQELALWNGIGSPYTVYPGQRLLVIPPN